MKKGNYAIIFFVMVFVLFSGCTSSYSGDSTQKDTKLNTQEFNLKTYLEYQPSIVKKGEDVLIKYYLENKGTNEITITPPNDIPTLKKMISFTCGSITDAYTIPKDLVGLNIYILKPGGSMAFVWEGHISENMIGEECKGNIRFGYDDKIDVLKYVRVINEKEYNSGKYTLSKDLETISSNGNVEVKVYVLPQEPVILNPNNNEKTQKLIVKIKNVGDGDIKIKKLDFNLDENIISNSCKINLENKILKSNEERVISCDISFKSVPKIEQKYRISIDIFYHVEFNKVFTIPLSASPTGYAILFTSGDDKIHNSICGKMPLPYLGGVVLNIDSGFVRNICPFIASTFTHLMIDSSLNYAKNKYGYREGVYWGNRYGERYSKLFAKAYCNKNKNKSVEKLNCLKEVKEGSSISDECLDTLYSLVDESKVKNKLIESRKPVVYNRIKSHISSSIRTNKGAIKKVVGELYEKYLSEKVKTKTTNINIFGIAIRSNANSFVKDALSYAALNLFMDSLNNHKKDILQRYSDGFMEGFKEGFKQGIENNIKEDVSIECGSGN